MLPGCPHVAERQEVLGSSVDVPPTASDAWGLSATQTSWTPCTCPLPQPGIPGGPCAAAGAAWPLEAVCVPTCHLLSCGHPHIER